DREPRIVDKNKNKNDTTARSSVAAQDPESGLPKVGPYNRALGEIYQRLYPEIRRPKPNQEAIAAALQAMQRLTMESDSEISVEEAVSDSTPNPIICSACGHRNRKGNRFCGGCGLSLEAISEASAGPGAENSQSLAPALYEDAPGYDEPEYETPAAADSAPAEFHPQPNASAGKHFYHHHYHHHYFQNGADAAPAPRAGAPESAREADRLRVAAAAKGETMSRSEAAVRRLTQEWILACNMRQLEELAELYAADALVLRSNLPPIRGAAAVREFFFASLEAGLGEVALDPMRVEVSGDLAHEVGRYSALVPGTVGKRREERGKYLWVFARQASGDWKLVAECWCSDLTITSAESDVPKGAIPLGVKPAAKKS
ncbi:MAG: nuclear transport factor 2 family protein, partial [Candidatus Sulfotelmatobacter sp.]